jgi:hypothetical protein
MNPIQCGMMKYEYCGHTVVILMNVSTKQVCPPEQQEVATLKITIPMEMHAK